MSLSKRLRVCSLWVMAMLACPLVALADPKDEIPLTGVTWVDTALKYLGGAYLLLTGIVAILPKTIPLVQGIARWVGDVRNAAKEGAKVQLAKAALRGDERGFVDVPTLLATASMVLMVVGVALWASACTVAKPACDVIHVADDACQMFLITLPDGTTERVPRAEITKLAATRRQMRLQGLPQ